VFCGSSTVFSNQTKYLTTRGYEVVEIAVQQGFWSLEKANQTTQEFTSNNVSSYAHKVLLLQLGIGIAPFLLLFIRRGRNLFRSQLARRALKVELAQLPKPWHEALASRPPRLVVVNHCWHMPLARKLFPNSRLILESHDIQTHQLDVHSRLDTVDRVDVDVDEALDDELDMMRSADAVIAINDDERQFFESKDGMPPLRTIYPHLSTPFTSNATRDDEVRRCTAELPPDKIDVVLVASNHPANVTSLRWFIKKVYQPYLASAGISILVVGNVVDALPREEQVIPFAGRVPDLMAYYKRARTVALPVVEGAGLPIKTMEAMSLGVPIVATSSAVRGLIGVKSAVNTFDEPEDFAKEIRHMLDNKSYRVKVAEAGYAYAKRTFSEHSYFSEWDQLIADMYS